MINTGLGVQKSFSLDLLSSPQNAVISRDCPFNLDDSHSTHHSDETQQIRPFSGALEKKMRMLIQARKAVFDRSGISDKDDGVENFFNGLLSNQGSFLAYAQSILGAFRALLSDQLENFFNNMQKVQESCRDAEEESNAVDELLSQMKAPTNGDVALEAVNAIMKLSNARGEIDTIMSGLANKTPAEVKQAIKKVEAIEIKSVMDYTRASAQIKADKANVGKTIYKKIDKNVYQYMEQHGITIDGVPVGAYTSGGTKNLDEGQMTAIKQALSNTADRSTDLASQENITIQKITQTFNTLMGIFNSIQTMLSDMNVKVSGDISH